MFNVYDLSLKNGILVAKSKGYSNLEMEGDSKVIIDCYNKRIAIPSSIMILKEDIWILSYGLNIYEYRHVYREANRTADCKLKKVLVF